MKDDSKTSTVALLASDGAFDPLEDGVRQRVRSFIEAILEEELGAALGRGRYELRVPSDCDHGRRPRPGSLPARRPPVLVYVSAAERRELSFHAALHAARR